MNTFFWGELAMQQSTKWTITFLSTLSNGLPGRERRGVTRQSVLGFGIRCFNASIAGQSPVSGSKFMKR